MSEAVANKKPSCLREESFFATALVWPTGDVRRSECVKRKSGVLLERRFYFFDLKFTWLLLLDVRHFRICFRLQRKKDITIRFLVFCLIVFYLRILIFVCKKMNNTPCTIGSILSLRLERPVRVTIFCCDKLYRFIMKRHSMKLVSTFTFKSWFLTKWRSFEQKW